MMLKRVAVVVKLLFFSSLLQGNAQALEAASDKTISIKFSPQHLLINGLHLYLERIPEQGSRHGFVFSPRAYNGKAKTVDLFAGRNWEDSEDDRVLGYGAEVQHKIYINNYTSPDKSRVYLAYGVNYHHFNLEFKREGWVKEMDPEGLEVYKYRLRPFNEKINRIGGVALFGLQVPALDGHLLFDFYSGAGIKNSSIQTDYSHERYNRNAMDYGYSGLHLLLGIMIGAAF
ncbi:hypothetical protein Q4E40_07995 [Pontibacter sp. BT731]|uniref:hypothetical protein n=1 Tax=Pontibacter coccineus TaxID=3063328 RepID=UPI0026E2BDB3|nr:hypothetical protein [Pontibacter sp. BT731]MDO6390062.1 hypothetical protein [Pontibacter sp. BT731]